MSAAKETTKAQTKKTEKKVKSRFHAVQSLHKTRENLMETVKGYNEQYVTKPFKSSKDFVVDMKNNPQKTFEGLYKNGKEFVQDARKDPKKVWRNLTSEGKDLARDARKNFSKAVDNVLDGGKDFYAGVGKDTQSILDDLFNRGKKLADRIPGKKTLEKGLSKSLKSIPDRLNLPSKKDMEKLSKTVQTLNGKLNTLSKQCSA